MISAPLRDIFLAAVRASALLVAPADGLTLKDLVVTNELLLASGVGITDSNTARKHLSKIKGGQLAVLAHPAPVLSLIVSDVIGDSLDSRAHLENYESYGFFERLALARPNAAHHLKTGSTGTNVMDFAVISVSPGGGGRGSG